MSKSKKSDVTPAKGLLTSGKLSPQRDSPSPAQPQAQGDLVWEYMHKHKSIRYPFS